MSRQKDGKVTPAPHRRRIRDMDATDVVGVKWWADRDLAMEAAVTRLAYAVRMEVEERQSMSITDLCRFEFDLRDKMREVLERFEEVGDMGGGERI